MSSTERISISVFCTHQGVDVAFIHALHERGLIRLVVQEEQACIEREELARVEQLTRMHQDLEINLEGLEAISHLLERMQNMQDEMRLLRDRLRLYEDGA
jgi:chaperone modulatory protein CbpM